MEQKILQEVNKKKTECVECPKCSSTWLEQVLFREYRKDHSVIPGQRIPPTNPQLPEFVLYRCLVCSELLEPSIIHQGYGRDVTTETYNDFLDTAEGKKDSREELDRLTIEKLRDEQKKLEAKIDALLSKKQ